MVFKKGEPIEVQNSTDELRANDLADEARKKTPISHKKKWASTTFLKLLTIGVIMAIAACVLTMLFSSYQQKQNAQKTIDRSSFPIVYTKEDGLYIKNGNRKTVQVSQFVDSSKQLAKATESENGRYIYFLENYTEDSNIGALFVSEKKANKNMIAYNVSPTVLPDQKGHGVALLQNYSSDTKTGDLSLYGTTDKLIKVDSDVSENEYAFSENGKYLLYLKNTDAGTKDLIVYDGQEKIYVDHDVKQIISVSNDMEVLYYKNVNTETNNSELYFWNQENGTQKVADDVYMGYLEKSPDLSMIAFLTGKTEQRIFTLNVFSQKTGRVIVDTNVSSVFETELPAKKFLYTKNKNEKNAMGELYVKWGSRDPEKITDSVYNQSQVLCSDDFKMVAYLEGYDIQNKNGILCKRAIQKGVPQEKEQIDKTVGEFSMSRDGSTCTYLKNIDDKQTGELYYAKDGKRVLIDKNVQNYNYKLLPQGKRIYYLKNYNVEKSGGDLYLADITSQMVTTKIDENVWNNFYFRGGNSILYYRNYNETTQRGELMQYEKKEAVSIDHSVCSLLFEYSKKY